MDQSKLYKAFERTKEQRDIEKLRSMPEKRTESESEVKPTDLASQRILTDMVPKENILSRMNTLSGMRNPNPLTVTDMRNKKLVYAGMKNRSVLNAYRELRIKLVDQSDSENLTVLICSVDPSENSIVTAMNLAISFSLDVNSSALLVDCNPYGTDLQRLVSAKFSDGITDYIARTDLQLEDIIYPSGIERVNVIPAGNNAASAVEHFSSVSMKELIYELKNRYNDRFIVINAPPVTGSSEARVLTRYCDHTVLTVPYGRSNIDSIEDAVSALGAANVSGVVYQQ